jgi:transposase
VHELTRLARTIRHWQSQVLAWHATGLTNGPTEAVNLLVKKVKRVGHGFRNFDNYRLRLLLHCGVRWRGCCVVERRGAPVAA